MNKLTREEIRKLVLIESTKRSKDLLSVAAPDGSKPVIVAFEDEIIRDVFERVSWSDGFANVFVIKGDEFMVLPVTPSTPGASPQSDIDLLPVSHDCDMGMLIHGLKAASGGSGTVQVSVHGSMADIRVMQNA